MAKNHPTATWLNENERGECTCSNCGFTGGQIADSWCPKCDSFMTNSDNTRKHRYFCPHCNSEILAENIPTVIKATLKDVLTNKAHARKEVVFCPACGESSIFEIKGDVTIELPQDGVSEEFINTVTRIHETHFSGDEEGNAEAITALNLLLKEICESEPAIEDSVQQ